MAITKTSHDFTTNTISKTEMFVNRVMTVEKTVETRNWSSTMDYTDYRTTDCTWALVWLGTHGLPPSKSRLGRHTIHYGCLRHDGQVPDYIASEVRDLEFWEQFAWVDCTNLFSDLNGYSLAASEDAMGGEPLMWANYVAWKAYHEARAEKESRELEASRLAHEKAEAEKVTKSLARAKKREAKELAGKMAAEARLSSLPEKGTTLTVAGFTGVVFWKGTTKYRSVWSARLGLRNEKGEISWVDGSTVT